MFIGTFIIPTNCCKDLILGTDFLHVHCTVIDIRDSVVAFKTCFEDSGDIEFSFMALCIANDGVQLPPRSCFLVAVQCKVPYTGEDVTVQATAPLLSRSVSVARGLVNFIHGCTKLLLMNFSEESLQIRNVQRWFFFDSLAPVQDCFVLVLQQEAPSVKAPVLIVGVSSDLPPAKWASLCDLISQFRDCFSSMARAGQMHLTKHRLSTRKPFVRSAKTLTACVT